MKNFTKMFLAICLLAGFAFSLNAQNVGINDDGSVPDNSAMLDVKSDSKGFLPPRMTYDQLKVISIPATGLIVFCTDCGPAGLGTLAINSNGVWFYLNANRIIPLAPVQGTQLPFETQITWNWNTSLEATGYKWNTVNDYATATDMGTATSKIETGLTCGGTSYTRYAWAYNGLGNSNSTALTQATLDCFTCGNPFTDTRDSKVYNSVVIGTQCWMKNNLNVGTMILGSVNQANNSAIEKYCYSDLDANCTTYGGLYQWNEMMQYSTTPGIQGICPSGWHLPTDAELTTLTVYIYNQVAWRCTNSTIAKAMAATTNWTTSATTCAVGNNLATNNASGFSVLPAGIRGTAGTFSSQLTYGYWWSSTPANASASIARNLVNSGASPITVPSADNLFGYSVRCLKN